MANLLPVTLFNRLESLNVFSKGTKESRCIMGYSTMQIDTIQGLKIISNPSHWEIVSASKEEYFDNTSWRQSKNISHVDISDDKKIDSKGNILEVIFFTLNNGDFVELERLEL